jgi:hypothetical protein
MSIFPISIFTEIFYIIIDDIVKFLATNFKDEGVKYHRRLLKYKIKTDLLPLLHSSPETRQGFKLLIFNRRNMIECSNIIRKKSVDEYKIFIGYNFNISFLFNIEKLPRFDDYFIKIISRIYVKKPFLYIYINKFILTIHQSIIYKNKIKMIKILDTAINKIYERLNIYDYSYTSEILSINRKYNINMQTKNHIKFLKYFTEKYVCYKEDVLEYTKKYIDIFLFGE